MLGEIEIGDDNKDIMIAEVGVDLGSGAGVAVAVSMTKGRYSDIRVFCNDDTAGGDDLQSTISGLNGGAGQNYTVSVNDVDGKITISAAGDFTIAWTDTNLRDELGWAADLTPAATGFTSPNGHKYRFAADRAIWWRRINDTELDEAVNVSHDGGMTARRFFESVLGVMEYRYVVADEELELWTFWQDIVRNRKAFNLYPDRANNTVWDKTSNDEGYRRWKLHESAKGWEPSYPQKPYAVHRHLMWPLRQDPRDSEFIAVGT